MQSQASASHEGRDLCLKSAPSTYIIFGAVVGSLILPWSYVALTKWPSEWQGVAVLVAIYAVWVLRFGSLRLTVSHGVIRYRTLLRQRSLLVSNIERSTFFWNVGGPFLVITPANGDEQLRVSLKPFRVGDIKELLALPELKLESRDHVA